MSRTAAAPERQAASAVLMIRPTAFTGNPETLASNAFQARGAAGADIGRRARAELDATAAALGRAGVGVHVFPGSAKRDCPDEVFPNNWVSFHADGTAVLYPMLAPSRRRERRPELLDALAREHGYAIRRTIDLTAHETHECFLEGTGSLVLDRIQRIAYACRSPRTSDHALADFVARLGYESVTFDALDAAGMPVYHTNIVISLGTRFAVLCLEAASDASARAALARRLESSGRQTIEITRAQMHGFAANILELSGSEGPVIALSRRAREGLGAAQTRALERHGELVVVDIPTIEAYGGGSLRCMLAEIFLPSGAG